MTGYTGLIKALRHCGKGGDVSDRCLPCEYYDGEPWCEAALVNDAADALEAAERLLDQNTKRCEALRKQLREAHESYEKHLAELEAQLPKHGEWVKNLDRCGWHCSYCKVDNYYAYSWNSETGKNEFQDNFCPNCGAKMDGKEKEQC